MLLAKIAITCNKGQMCTTSAGTKQFIIFAFLPQCFDFFGYINLHSIYYRKNRLDTYEFPVTKANRP